MPRIVLIALSALLLAACDGPLDRSGLRSELLPHVDAFVRRELELPPRQRG